MHIFNVLLLIELDLLLLRLCCVTYKRLEEEGSVLQEKLNTVKTVWVKWTWIEHTLIHYIIVELWNRR